MDSAPADGTRHPPRQTAPCTFPRCDGVRVTETGMCDVHRRVVVSSTGSWLEAG